MDKTERVIRIIMRQSTEALEEFMDQGWEDPSGLPAECDVCRSIVLSLV